MITRRLPRASGLLSSSSWTCPQCTKSAPFIQQNARQIPSQRRDLHSMPTLEHHNTFSKSGVTGLFAPQGYTIGWTQYQSHLIQKLNSLVAGEPYENYAIKALVMRFAHDPMAASIFNHASMAFNNHYFYDSLSTAPKTLEEYGDLKLSLEASFGSIDTLRMTMLDTANAMFGPGFVWLVWCPKLGDHMRRGAWRIVTTYLAGTPYPEAGYRQQGIDMNNQDASSAAAYMDRPANSVGWFGPLSPSGQDNAKLPPGATSVHPVLCVSTWEHSYLYDYSAAGKRQYLDQWWESVDWHTVDTRMTGIDYKRVEFVAEREF
ncbi:manganese and iron superoxide dismutase [Polychaeton citri CBS 116435]|uniref:Manganese and iron superoxide dismutase n=1 Tax=Polychaeton citri CBS 116435 TaxID=1314669 RepID=A0A9P4Q688_9PEZI|nr:manganese and iron superoxide dismutase [Polychaeton citri CBS 116435]